MYLRAITVATLLLLGCGDQAWTVDASDAPDGPDAPDAPDAPDDCPVIFAQDILPEYRVQIAAGEWAAMQDEFLNRTARETAGLDPSPYHPIEVEYVAGDERFAITKTLLRLKGQSSWMQTILLDAKPKMQFVMAFNEVDPGGRFMGVRKVEFDMPRTDRTFLRQRAGLYAMRAAGITAQCANNARLYINGEYYGLYSHLERLDKEFLQRNYPAESDGDLWKNGREIKTNEDTFSWERLSLLWDVIQTPAELDELADLDASIHEWAAEAMIGDADGVYNGRANFFLYDHPTRGFIWLPHDLDTVLDKDFLPATASPMLPDSAGRWEIDWKHYLMVVNDPVAAERYVTALADVRATFDTARLQRRLDTWQQQIAVAAAEDPHRPFTMGEHDHAVMRAREYVDDRATYVDAWLACRANGGVDADGDGFDFCSECNDLDANVGPNTVEVCNGVDDDCDGLIDDGPSCN